MDWVSAWRPARIRQLRELVNRSRAELTPVMPTRHRQINEPARCLLLPACCGGRPENIRASVAAGRLKEKGKIYVIYRSDLSMRDQPNVAEHQRAAAVTQPLAGTASVQPTQLLGGPRPQMLPRQMLAASNRPEPLMCPNEPWCMLGSSVTVSR